MPWQYDTNLSKVEWAVQYLGIAVIKGNFKEVQAVLNFEDPDPTKWSVEATIDAASFSSGGDIVSPDFSLKIAPSPRRSISPTTSLRSRSIAAESPPLSMS